MDRFALALLGACALIGAGLPSTPPEDSQADYALAASGAALVPLAPPPVAAGPPACLAALWLACCGCGRCGRACLTS